MRPDGLDAKLLLNAGRPFKPVRLFQKPVDVFLEFLETYRLGKAVVGPALEYPFDVLGAVGRDGEYLDVFRALVLLYAPADLEAVKLGHPDVQDHELRLEVADLYQPLVPVPGRLNETWFNARETGIYYGQCSELCGKDHAFMPIAVRVVTKEEFATFMAAMEAGDYAAGNATLAAIQ